MAQITIVAEVDSFMDGASGNTNHGAETTIYNGEIYAGGSKVLQARPIGNFNVAALASATITDAQLERYLTVGPATFAATLYRCTRTTSWTENGVTWNKYDGENNWTTGGGDYDGTTPTPIAYTEPVTNGWHTLTGLGPFVTDAISNRGGIVSIIMRADDENPETDKYVIFSSREQTSNKWLLRINYTGSLIKTKKTIVQLNQAVNISNTY